MHSRQEPSRLRNQLRLALAADTAQAKDLRIHPLLQAACGFIDGLFDAAIVLDLKLEVLHANSVYRQATGLGLRQFKKALLEPRDGIGLFRAEGDVDRAFAMECLERREIVRHAEVQVRPPDRDDSFPAWIGFTPVLNDEGRTLGLIQVIRDMSVEATLHKRYREVIAKEQERAGELERLVGERTQELKHALDQVTHLARTDPLTGLLNRRAFTEHAEHALNAARRHGRHAGVVMCDLDNFKSLNDTYGHQAGDVVLVAAANAIRTCVRESDILARFGGEEFIVLLTETTPERVADIGERYRVAVRGMPITELVPAKSTPQTVSVGIALFPGQAASLDQLIRAADDALYRAKDAGRDKVCLALGDEP